MFIEKIKKFFQINTLEISLLTGEDLTLLPEHDEVIIIAPESSFLTIPFEITKENIDIAEQIRWHINSVLEKPIEHYVLSYHIHHEDEQKILGIGALLDKETIDTLTQKIPNLKMICSSDKQYIFYQKNIPFWNMPSLLKKIKKTLQYSTLVLAPFFTSAFLFLNEQINLNKNILIELTNQENILSKKYTAYRQHLKLIELTKENQSANEKLFTLLIEIVRKTPKEIKFSKLTYSANGEILINGQTNKNFTFLNKYQKSLAKIKNIQTALLEKTTQKDNIDFAIRLIPKTPKGKNKNA